MCCVEQYIHVCNCDMFSVVNVYLDHFNGDDVCMFVVNKQFELLEFVFDSVYVDLQYEIFHLGVRLVS